MAPLAGKEAIRSALKQMAADPALSLKFEATRVEVASAGDSAYTQGSYTLTVTDSATKKPVNDKGSYVTVYKKQADGSWKAVSDIASSSTPPMPPPAPKK
jgi:ketosteroid isomerase-like protein